MIAFVLLSGPELDGILINLFKMLAERLNATWMIRSSRDNFWFVHIKDPVEV